MPNPITRGLQWVSAILAKYVVRDASGTERAVFDTDGYLYQLGVKITASAAKLNATELVTNGPSTFYRRFTIAEVNAGQTLINPSATGKWRVLDGWVRAIGGAVSAVTSIDIKEETSNNAVLNSAQANLTQNTILRPGSTGVTATYLGVESTAGKKLLLAKNGTDAATATHLDVCFTYVMTTA